MQLGSWAIFRKPHAIARWALGVRVSAEPWVRTGHAQGSSAAEGVHRVRPAQLSSSETTRS